MKIKCLIFIFTLFIASCASVNNEKNTNPTANLKTIEKPKTEEAIAQANDKDKNTLQESSKLLNDESSNQKIIPDISIPDGMGAIVFFRENKFVASAVDMSVYANDKFITKIPNESYKIVNLIAKNYKFRAANSKTEDLEIDLKPDQLIFLKLTANFFGKSKMAAGADLELESNPNTAKIKSLKFLGQTSFSTEKPVYVLEDGSIYEGDTYGEGMPHGHGLLKYPESNSRISYEGNFKYGKPHGYGVYTHRNGDIYKGELVNGFANGKGIFEAANYIYEGDFKKNRSNGFGTLKYKNGIEYSGEFSNGVINGKGKVIFKDSIYEGNFYKDKIQGKGIYKFNDGRVYEGDLIDGKPNGNGKFIRSDGSFIVGRFNDGKFLRGRYFSSSGELIRDDDNLQQKSNLAEVGSFLADLSVFALKLTNAVLTGYNSANSRRTYDDELLNLEQTNYGTSSRKSALSIGGGSNKSSSEVSGCTSDFSCGFGYSCVKKPFTSNGICMKSVDSTGLPTYDSPSTNSIGVRDTKSCDFDSDCPATFRCDINLKSCVR